MPNPRAIAKRRLTDSTVIIGIIVASASYDYNEKRMTRFNTSRHNIIWLFTAIIFACIISWFVNTYPPQLYLYIGICITLIGCAIFSSVMYLTNNVLRAVLMTCGGIIYLVLRFLYLREALYSILLLILVVTSDAYLSKRSID